LITLILFCFKANSSIFIVDNYSFLTTVNKIKQNRSKIIEEIKKKSLNDFLKSITIKSDYKNIGNIKNYQEFLKSFIVKNEFKKKKNYEIICKIEFNQFKINNLLKMKNIKYINLFSSPILIVIVDKKENKLDLWSNERYEINWIKNFNNLLNTFTLNGDIKDINFLKQIESENYQFSKFNKLTENYGVSDFIFIIFDYDTNNEKENVFVKYKFNNLKFSKKFKLKTLNNNEISNFTKKLVIKLNNSWKEIQILAPVKNNSVIFNYKLKNLSDYVESQDILKNNNMIISFEDIEVTKTKYKGKISFLGTLENLNESLSNSGFLFKKKNNGLLLKRND